ncbi:MAG: helix-turn-helix domain-containing protein [Reyranella sp.]|uniref:helix-turn-helix domain-containing protein n=1 Tax=Reyranella sp. TaxID=1929291 RepID=UPI0012037B9D|nr:helix-turn-helix domain-containing protein [Reyranella sp.]TAJ40218.1 MAG: helix-turn-helix domain-containing protein [Reyranella sp.]
MSFYDQNRPFGAPIGIPVGVPEAPPVDGLSWADAAYLMRIHKQGFHPPAHMRGMSLAQLEAKAREETREAREAEEARQSAARIANAPKAIERALLDGPSSKRALPAQRGWRLRVRYLNQARRGNTLREAAARVGIDESTARRWRIKYPKFAAHLATIVEERHRQNADDLKLRAGEPRSRAVFFRGKQIGEQVMHDDRALMFLLKLEDGQRARAEAREERREQRAHEIRLKEMEIEARRETKAISKTPASDVHPVALAEPESPAPINDLPAVPADIAPPQVVEVASQAMTPSGPTGHLPRDGGGEESNSSPAHSAGEVPAKRAEGVMGTTLC